MSNAGENTMPLGDAREIEAQAADWFQRRRFWNWTDEDQKKLDAWLEESMAHSVAFWRLETGFEGTERLTALRHPRFGTVEEAPRGRWRPIFSAPPPRWS
jgi:ferric-dicitrate binding protein FerR (iron transport regulator)